MEDRIYKVYEIGRWFSKSLVTSGAGFIGSHPVDALMMCKCFVIVLDNFSSGRIKEPLVLA